MCRRRIICGEHAADNWVNGSLIQFAQNALDAGCEKIWVFNHRQSMREAGHRRMLLEECMQPEAATTAQRAGSQADQPSQRSKAIKASTEQASSDRLQNHIHSASVGGVKRGLHEVGRGVVDQHIGAQLTDSLQFVIVARREERGSQPGCFLIGYAVGTAWGRRDGAAT